MKRFFFLIILIVVVALPICSYAMPYVDPDNLFYMDVPPNNSYFTLTETTMAEEAIQELHLRENGTRLYFSVNAEDGSVGYSLQIYAAPASYSATDSGMPEGTNDITLFPAEILQGAYSDAMNPYQDSYNFNSPDYVDFGGYPAILLHGLSKDGTSYVCDVYISYVSNFILNTALIYQQTEPHMTDVRNAVSSLTYAPDPASIPEVETSITPTPVTEPTVAQMVPDTSVTDAGSQESSGSTDTSGSGNFSDQLAFQYENNPYFLLYVILFLSAIAVAIFLIIYFWTGNKNKGNKKQGGKKSGRPFGKKKKTAGQSAPPDEYLASAAVAGAPLTRQQYREGQDAYDRYEDYPRVPSDGYYGNSYRESAPDPYRDSRRHGYDDPYAGRGSYSAQSKDPYTDARYDRYDEHPGSPYGQSGNSAYDDPYRDTHGSRREQHDYRDSSYPEQDNYRSADTHWDSYNAYRSYKNSLRQSDPYGAGQNTAYPSYHSNPADDAGGRDVRSSSYREPHQARDMYDDYYNADKYLNQPRAGVNDISQHTQSPYMERDNQRAAGSRYSEAGDAYRSGQQSPEHGVYRHEPSPPEDRYRYDRRNDAPPSGYDRQAADRYPDEYGRRMPEPPPAYREQQPGYYGRPGEYPEPPAGSRVPREYEDMRYYEGQYDHRPPARQTPKVAGTRKERYKNNRK